MCHTTLVLNGEVKQIYAENDGFLVNKKKETLHLFEMSVK